MMFTNIAGHENQTCRSRDYYYQKHCVLIASTSPSMCPAEILKLPSSQSVNRSNGPKSANIPKLFYDTLDVAKHFAQCLVSLSVISPRQDHLFTKIFIKAKHDPGLNDAELGNVKNPDNFFILISKYFLEAHSALHKSEMFSSPMNLLTNKTAQLPLSESSETIGFPEKRYVTTPMTDGNIPVLTVKVEPWTMPLDLPVPILSHPPTHATFRGEQSLPTALSFLTSQDISIPSQNRNFSKIWEGALLGEIQNQHVHVRLEAYKSADALGMIANGWPSTMKIIFSVYAALVDKLVFASAFVKQFAGKADIVYFYKIGQPELFYQFPLVEEWQFIRLPYQILLLRMTRHDDCWGGFLFPSNMEESMSELMQEIRRQEHLFQLKAKVR